MKKTDKDIDLSRYCHEAGGKITGINLIPVKKDRYGRTHQLSVKVQACWYSIGLVRGSSFYVNPEVGELERGQVITFRFEARKDEETGITYNNVLRSSVSLVQDSGY